ncbi:hypothetical protein D3C72_1945800 [compost metagenome]
MPIAVSNTARMSLPAGILCAFLRESSCCTSSSSISARCSRHSPHGRRAQQMRSSIRPAPSRMSRAHRALLLAMRCSTGSAGPARSRRLASSPPSGATATSSRWLSRSSWKGRFAGCCASHPTWARLTLAPHRRRRCWSVRRWRAIMPSCCVKSCRPCCPSMSCM